MQTESVAASSKRSAGAPSNGPRRKKPRRGAPAAAEHEPNYFGWLPDDLVVSILSKLSASSGRPSDLATLFITCKRFNVLGLNPLVLSKSSPELVAIRAKNWSEEAHLFLKRCADAGNLEALHILGMIKFYCLERRREGVKMMARAAYGSHADALYSLAIIQFNGSGGCLTSKDFRAGVALLARAAFLSHVDAIRELGHCLQDGYGVRQNVKEGRRFLLQANAMELVSAIRKVHSHLPVVFGGSRVRESLLFSDFGCNVPDMAVHPANRFLGEWFSARPPAPELRLCSHPGCGRPETRKHEYRRCSVCGTVNYCSRTCQALHWRLAHQAECVAGNQEAHHAGGAGQNDDGGEAPAVVMQS